MPCQIGSTRNGLRLSTGVMVMYVDDESFAFALPEGHMFAGWITFSGNRSITGREWTTIG